MRLERRSSEQTGRLTVRQEQERTSANGCQEQFANHLMLHVGATPRVVNDKEKREQRILQVRV